MAVRVPVMIRLTKDQAAAVDTIGEEMVDAAGVKKGDSPFYFDGKINRSEILRRLLGQADERLRAP